PLAGVIAVAAALLTRAVDAVVDARVAVGRARILTIGESAAHRLTGRRGRARARLLLPGGRLNAGAAAAHALRPARVDAPGPVVRGVKRPGSTDGAYVGPPPTMSRTPFALPLHLPRRTAVSFGTLWFSPFVKGANRSRVCTERLIPL